jgi:aminopeptidase-like protein
VARVNPTTAAAASPRCYEDTVDMMTLLRELAPLHRTLACRATDRALEIISGVVPEARIEGVPSGSKAWTWTIPKRWELESATIRAGGKVLVDARDHHLHVINYSQPFRGTVSRQELLRHLHTKPDRPQAIPFRFSYYTPDWGFCVPHAWLDRFAAQEYEVEIRARFEDGPLNVLSARLPGRHLETLILSANICHPTQVNDSLTGVAAVVDVFRRLAARPERKYSYLLLVAPEMIGSIAFLSRHPEVIEDAVGAVCTEMLGTGGALVLQRSRRGDTYWDGLLQEALEASGLPHRSVPFIQSASNDERVLDSPGVDIPTPSMTRYPYPEYHSSDDNIGLIDEARLREGRDVLQSFIDLAEADYVPVLCQPGPIFLSGYGLYPDWYKDPSLWPMLESFNDVMYALDGRLSVAQIAHKLGRRFGTVRYWTDAFASKDLLTRNEFFLRRPEPRPG